MTEQGGNWLRRHRKAARLTQAEAANLAGISASYISTIEREQKHSQTDARLRPEPEKLIAIAKAVQGDPNEILEIYGYAPISPPDSDLTFDGVGSLSFQKDLPPDEREKYEMAVKTTVAAVKALIDSEKQNEQ